MFVVSTVKVGTICRPSLSVKAFLGSAVVHSKEPVLNRMVSIPYLTSYTCNSSPERVAIHITVMKHVPKTSSLNLIAPIVRIYLGELIFKDETVLVLPLAKFCLAQDSRFILGNLGPRYRKYSTLCPPNRILWRLRSRKLWSPTCDLRSSSFHFPLSSIVQPMAFRILWIC
jgi:hypothetical protein